MSGTENFVKSFHNLEGVTLGKRKESLNKLLQAYSTSETKSTIDLTSVQPRTYLESIFKIDALIHFHKTTELLDVFKGGNEIFIKKVIKHPWFLKEVFCGLDPKQLVNDYLPYLSFSIRMKVLKKISNILEERIMDDIFDCLIDRYGLSIATTVVSSCSKNKIKSILTEHHLKLSTGQLKKIFNKDPELILTYLEEYKITNTNKFEDQKLLTYIAQKNPEYFWKICENYNCNVRLGSKTTKKMLGQKEDKVVNDPEKYVKYFRQDKMIRILGRKNLFKKVYQNVFPKTKSDIENVNVDSVLFKQLLKYYPKKDQFFMFERTFEKIIGESIWKNIKCVDNNLLNSLNDTTVRENMALEKYNETRDLQFLKYYKIQKSLAEIKEKINATSSAVDRAKLIELLIETCYVNNDLVALADVLKYFSTRHRHDDRVTRKSCLLTILAKYGDHLDDFNENHWESLNEIIAIQKINNEYLWNVKKLQIKYMEFLFRNKQPLEKHINQFLKGLDSVYLGGAFDNMSYIKNPQFEKTVYQHVIDILPTLAKNADEADFKFGAAILVYDVFNHNIKNPDQKIENFENETFRKYVIDACKSEAIHYYTADLVGKLICKTTRSKFEEELVPIYFRDTCNKCPYNTKVIRWFTDNDPKTLEKYGEHLIKDYMSFGRLNWNKIKKYSHADLEKKFIATCKEQLSNETVRVDLKVRICEILGRLMSTQEYFQYCKETLPEPSTKLNLDNEEATAKYTIGRELVKNLRYVTEPQKVLPLILQYCTSDYLQTTLPALYTAFYRIPENSLPSYLNQMVDNERNSTSKHAIFLSAIVSTKSQNIALFKSFITNTNDELHKNLLRSSLKYFVRNPCSETFEIALVLLNGLRGTDDESFQLIVSLRFPQTYKTGIIMKCWKVLEKLKIESKDSAKYNKYQFKLINSLDIDFDQNAVDKFCENVIQENFLKTDESCLAFPGISHFVVKFLSASPRQKENSDFVFHIVAKFKQEMWLSNRGEAKFVYYFFKVFYESTQQENLINNATATYFTKNWLKIFSPIEAFDEFILLNLLILKQDGKNTKSSDSYCKKLCDFLNDVFNEYHGILSRVSENVNFFLENVPLNEKVNLYHMILKENENVKSDFIFMVVISLMRTLDKSALDVESKIHHGKIESILRNVQSNDVKLHYNLYVKDTN